MASTRHTNRPIHLRPDDTDEEYVEEDADQDVQDVTESDASSVSNSGQRGASSENDSEKLSEGSAANSSNENGADFKDISFGALAKAQATFAPTSKTRNRTSSATLSKPSQNLDTSSVAHSRPVKQPKQDMTARTSKHAPVVLSSKYPVSRKRTILSPPATAKPRDPRFDPAVTSRTLNANAVSQADKAYSFLTDYQATEILHLKSEIAKSQKSDPAHAEELKKQLMSMEARMRNAHTRSKEREILRKHKSQEKQAIRDGKKSKPYFLKQSDVRKEIERDRLGSMGKKQRDRMEKRKMRREKAKSARDMPWSRRMG